MKENANSGGATLGYLCRSAPLPPHTAAAAATLHNDATWNETIFQGKKGSTQPCLFVCKIAAARACHYCHLGGIWRSYVSRYIFITGSAERFKSWLGHFYMVGIICPLWLELGCLFVWSSLSGYRQVHRWSPMSTGGLWGTVVTGCIVRDQLKSVLSSHRSVRIRIFEDF